jgi:CubicO group peptidase (beta-lactamase class C family)
MNYSMHKDLSWCVKCRVLVLSLFLFFFISPLEIFSQSNTEDLENYSAKSKEDSLVFSAWDGNLYRVKELVSDGVDINAKVGYGLTTLHCAMLRGNKTLHEWLIENGADPNIKMPERNQIADMIFKKDAVSTDPGGALVIIQDNTLIHKSYYGMANLEHSVPITPNTVFKLASVSKQFVAFAICMLVEQGKISLDDDIRKYIPEMHDFGYTITIRQLLNHTAGFRDTMGSLCLAGWDLNDVIKYEHLLTLAFNQKRLNFEPGSEHLYSNTGYVLLAEIVNRVSGEPFPICGRTNILEPLKMSSSFIRNDYTEIISGRAYGYTKGRDGKYYTNPDSWAMIGPSGIYSTIEDMAKWTTNFDQQQVGGQEVFNLMFQQGKLNDGKTISYASGLDITEYRGAKTIGHGGGGAGFTTFVMYLPEYHVSLIVLYNTNNNVHKTINDIIDVYLGDKLQSLTEPSQVDNIDLEVQVSADQLDTYIGTYKVFQGFYITISRDGHQLMALETNKDIQPIKALSETEF